MILADRALPAFQARIDGLAAASIEAPQRGVARVGSTPVMPSVEGASLRALLEGSAGELADPEHVRIASYRFGSRASP